MTNDSIYDIGDTDRYLAQEQPKGSQVAKGSTRATVNRVAPLRRHESAFRFELAGTFSLFLPGSGQLLLGRIAPGFFFIASLGFLGALSWAVISNMDRLAPTLVLLGLPRASGVWSLGVIYGLATGLYLWNVLCSGNPTLRSSSAAPPWLAALASLVLPGWGQYLNRRRLSAMLFLGGLWVVGLAWFLPSPPAARFLTSQNLILPPVLLVLTTPVVRWCLTAALWGLAVYDAWSSAASQRRLRHSGI